MKNFLVSILLFFSNPLFALGQPVEVTVSIGFNGKTDEQIRIMAKNKAVIDALDKLPAVVWGTESSENGNYTDSIKSIGFAQADVSVASETFDREGDLYTLDAIVQWDEEKILNTLKLVQQGQNATKTLDQLKSLIDPTAIQKFIDQKSNDIVAPTLEAQILVNPIFYSTSYEEYKNLHLGLITELAIALSNKLIDQASKIQFTLVSADSFAFKYRLSKPETNDNLVFNSALIEQFYNENEDNVRNMTGKYCLFSPILLNVFRFTPLESYKPYTVDIVIDTKFISKPHAEYLFKGGMLPFDILLCDKKSLEEAIPLRNGRGIKLSN